MKERVDILTRAGVLPQAGITFTGKISEEKSITFKNTFGLDYAKVLGDGESRRKVLGAIENLLMATTNDENIIDMLVEETEDGNLLAEPEEKSDEQ